MRPEPHPARMCPCPEERWPMLAQVPNHGELGLPCPASGGAPRPVARRRSTQDRLCCMSSPYNSAPRALRGSQATVPSRAGQESNAGCCPEGWQHSPDKRLQLCQGNRYPAPLPGASRLVFPGKTHEPCVGLGPEHAGSPPSGGSRPSPSGPQERAGARLGMLGSVGVSEEGTVLASLNVVHDKSRRASSQPASVPRFVLHGLPAKRL